MRTRIHRRRLPSHAALLSGQLPFENGVRDEGLRAEGSGAHDRGTAAQSRLQHRRRRLVVPALRRGHRTSRRGFSFYDAEIPDEPLEEGALPERDGLATFDARRPRGFEDAKRPALISSSSRSTRGSADAVVGGWSTS